jgi:hypothetical protein
MYFINKRKKGIQDKRNFQFDNNIEKKGKTTWWKMDKTTQ